MKISIITVNYNNHIGLERTMQSVFQQRMAEIHEVEYNVIDGGSTDASEDLLRANHEKINYWVSEKDRGVYHAMNKGILNSSGKYLVFLNSGDCFINDTVLNKCCEYIVETGCADVYYGDALFTKNDGYEKPFYRSHPSKVSLSYFRRDSINHQASLISAHLFKEFGLYPENYNLASDFWLYLLAILEKKVFKHINSALVFYDTTGMSAADDYQAYNKEKSVIWDALFSEGKYSRLLTDELDIILKEGDYAKYTLTHKIVKPAVWIDEKLRKLRHIMAR